MTTSQKLILIDHDGTLCQTSPTAYDSLNYALSYAVRKTKTTPRFIQLDSLMSQLTGTTEKRLVQELISLYQIPPQTQSRFESAFYQGRTNWYKTMKSHEEFVLDTYYPDIEFMLQQASLLSDYHFGLVTGNPRSVIEQRLSPHIEHFFSRNKMLLGAFGEESTSRSQLIQLAIQKATQQDPTFRPEIGTNNFTTNVYYIGDSKHDLISGLKAKVRTIYIPSRSLQHVKSIKNDEYVTLLANILEGCMLITHDLSSLDALTFLGLK